MNSSRTGQESGNDARKGRISRKKRAGKVSLPDTGILEQVVLPRQPPENALRLVIPETRKMACKISKRITVDQDSVKIQPIQQKFRDITATVRGAHSSPRRTRRRPEHETEEGAYPGGAIYKEGGPRKNLWPKRTLDLWSRKRALAGPL